MKRPDFFIVGAAKSGTTSLSHYLRQHSEIFMPSRELNFFASDLRLRRDVLTKERYLSYFSNIPPDSIRVGEKSVSYLYSKQAASEIKAFCPEARIIIMLRNPVDLIYSLHSYLVGVGWEDICDFELALAVENERKRGLRIPRDTPHPDFLLYRELARLTEQVRRYLDTFGRENIKVIIYEDFKNATSKVYRDALGFLGVDNAFQPDFFVKNPNRGVRSKILHQIFARMLARPPERARKLAHWSLAPEIRQVLRETVLRVNLQSRPRPPMDCNLRNLLQAEFASEVVQLSQMLGCDLTLWIKEDMK